MPIIAEVGRRSWKVRLTFFFMYLVLAILGVTMAWPFLMTITASATNAYDYQRFDPIPRSVYNRSDRFVRGIVAYYPDNMRNGMDQFMLTFDGVPSTWSTWQAAGAKTKDNATGLETNTLMIRDFAQYYLAMRDDPAQWEQVKKMAADVDEFASTYDIDDCITAFYDRQVGPFYRSYYRTMARETGMTGDMEKNALKLMSDKWGINYTSFFVLTGETEKQIPWDMNDYYWPNREQGRLADFSHFRQSFRERQFLPGGIKRKWFSMLASRDSRQILGLPEGGNISVKEINDKFGTEYGSLKETFPVRNPGDDQKMLPLWKLWQKYTGEFTPMCETRPFQMKYVWLKVYLSSADVRADIGLKEGGLITIKEYNEVFGTKFASLKDTPFPVSKAAIAACGANSKLWDTWVEFISSGEGFPLRMMEVAVTPAIEQRYRDFLKERAKGDLKTLNRLMKVEPNNELKTWNELKFANRMPTAKQTWADVWREFVRKELKGQYDVLRPHCAETDYQAFLLKKYTSLAEVNKAYGWNLNCIEQAQMPYDRAYLVSFVNNEFDLYMASITQNYSFVLDYLLLRGRAVFNTLVLIALTLLAALTVNPLAAYALSRFQMKQMPSIILFMLATMAFPAAVTMIPGFLLMRDLHLLNTYAALILPSVANGMSIFLLKGFFDSLPPELYEAAALDGAKEWQMFTRITLPLSKPILAVIALTAFITAYNGWEWAIIVCQKESMWTWAVWLFQFNTIWSSVEPSAVMASFIISSLPVFLVFLFCQNIILRGIILPQMK